MSKRIVYVIQEFPVTTQTFVENEAMALENMGYRVTRFPLRLTSKDFSGSPDVITVGAILGSLKRWPAILRALMSLMLNWKSVFHLVSAEKFSVKDISRQGFALFNSIILKAYLISEDVPVDYIHAHFLGRCLDVVSYTSELGSLGARISATGHAGDVTNPPRPLRLRQQVNKLDAVVCASQAVANALKQGTGRIATAVVHCGIKVQGPSRTKASYAGPVRILSVGRLVEKKGFSDAIAAAEFLRHAGRDFSWKIIGSGPLEEELSRASAELVAAGKVEWLGSLPSSAVLAMMREWADVFVLPCRQASDGDVDGIPVALMEAMTAGVAVIAGNVAGIPELIAPDRTGYLVAPGNVSDLGESIARAMDSPDVRAVIATAGKEFVDREFNQLNEAAKLATAVFQGQSRLHTSKARAVS